MDKKAINRRLRELYGDELQYAIGCDEKVDLQRARSRAAMRAQREFEGLDTSGVWLGFVEAIARKVEQGFEEDLIEGRLRLGGAFRTGDLVFVPSPRMRERDWLAFDERREIKVREHVTKRDRERSVVRGIVERIRVYGGDPTTIEACPDLFVDEDEVAA